MTGYELTHDIITCISIVLCGLRTGESGANDGMWEEAIDRSSASTVSSCGEDAEGVLDADIPPEDARDTSAADDDEKLRNIAKIESALEIFGVLKHKNKFKEVHNKA